MSTPVHLVILRVAALLAPREQRAEWLAEWRGELWYASSYGGAKAAALFCLGAFRDALWLRRNRPPSPARRLLSLESPVQCVAFLAVLAALSAFLVFQLPAARRALLPSPYRDETNLVVVSTHPHRQPPLPAVTLEEYQSWVGRAQDSFTDLAFYEPALMSLQAGPRTVELSVALATDNLFEVLGIRLAPHSSGESQLILGPRAWRKYFAGDPHIAGRRVNLSGQSFAVAAAIAEDSWRLPGRIDAWLLVDERRLSRLPSGSKGFVLAHVRTSTVLHRSNAIWHVCVPNEKGGRDQLDCIPLAPRIELPFLAIPLMMGITCLVFPTATSLSLGAHPTNRRSPCLVIRLRRWVFLSAKIALIVPIMFFGVALLSAFPMQPHALLAGCILAFRWALVDQRRRCPVCLRLLANPVRIGQASQNFLGWYGTELMCVRGHGLLHVPECPTSSFGAPRWLYLDPSWSGLFS